jgi:hypothetical protein
VGLLGETLNMAAQAIFLAMVATVKKIDMVL